VQGVVGSVRQVDFGMHPYSPHLLLGPISMQGPAGLSLAVGDSNACKVESRWGFESETWYGPSPRASPRSGVQARFFPTERPVGIMGWAVWMKSQPTRMVVHSRRGLGLARMLVESWPAGDPRSVDPSDSVM
jgi:hypothetical protein